MLVTAVVPMAGGVGGGIGGAAVAATVAKATISVTKDSCIASIGANLNSSTACRQSTRAAVAGPRRCLGWGKAEAEATEVGAVQAGAAGGRVEVG